MASEVDICNMALSNIGDVANITSINPPEGSAQAERCAQYYTTAVNVLLEMHDWNFASRRISLTKYAECDRNNWKNKYALPAKCLKVIDIRHGDGELERTEYQLPHVLEKSSHDYEIGIDENGNRCIYTDIDDAVARYIMSVDAGLFSTMFTVALSWKISAFLAGPMIKGSEGAKMVQSCEQMCMSYLHQAMVLDARQHSEHIEQIPDWIKGR